MKILEGFNGNG